MIRPQIKNKTAAIELSIGTMVIIVLAILMLVLGVVLIRNIFTGATESVDILEDKVKGEITGLFSNEQADIVVKAGADRTVKIRPGSGPFGVPIGARTPDGSQTNRERLRYSLSLDSPSRNNCASTLGVKTTENLFVTPMNSFRAFDEFQGSNVFAIVQIEVPEGTSTCSQKVFIDVRDTQTNIDVGGSFFIVEILKERFF
jgi:hypothetical protein